MDLENYITTKNGYRLNYVIYGFRTVEEGSKHYRKLINNAFRTGERIVAISDELNVNVQEVKHLTIILPQRLNP